MNKFNLIYSLGGAVATSLLAPSIALASENPFAMQTVSSGMQLTEMSKGAEGKCGEEKCGEGKCGDKG